MQRINRGKKIWKGKCGLHVTEESLLSQTKSVKQYCDKCKKAIQITSTPLKCLDCDKVCHKYHTCSGILPYNNTLIWKCEQHRDAEHEVLKCSVCNKVFGNPLSSLQCQKCLRRCHRTPTCSKISKGSKYPVWDCGNHQDDAPVINFNQQVSTCHFCNGLIKKNCGYFKCEECDNKCHKQTICSKIKQNNRRKSLPIWNCGSHSRIEENPSEESEEEAEKWESQPEGQVTSIHNISSESGHPIPREGNRESPGPLEEVTLEPVKAAVPKTNSCYKCRKPFNKSATPWSVINVETYPT